MKGKFLSSTIMAPSNERMPQLDLLHFSVWTWQTAIKCKSPNQQFWLDKSSFQTDPLELDRVRKPNESQPTLTTHGLGCVGRIAALEGTISICWFEKNIWRQFNSTQHLICITMIPLLAGRMWFFPSKDSGLLLIMSCGSGKGGVGVNHAWARHHG